ncbi:tail fiber domain-containing protein, partial [Candidatus Pacearchaeota archaeon]|nr:tail fiber domain-containing protein [Candidatus Pacearchaeota archaeon]
FTTVDNDVVLVKNWSGTAYHDITNLYDIVADSGGNAIGATKWFKIVIWGVANLTGSGFEPMIINLPSGFYNTQAACELDADGHADVVIPTEFRGTGYLIASVVIQRAATWVIGSTKDLRGQTPSTVGGGGSRYTDAEVEAYVNSVANAGIATGDSLVFVDVTDGALKQDLVSDLNVLAVAAVKAEDPLALAGDLTTATGKSITSGDDIIANDGDFPIMSYRAGNADRPSVEFDTNDALFYNQTNNDFQFVIGSTVEFFVTPTLIYVPSNKVGIKMVPTTDLELANDSAQKPTTNTWTITSDEAIKQDIQDYTLGLAALMNIRPRQFKYKPVYDIDKTHDMDKTHVGLVAQEIELVVPSTVSMGKRNYNFREVDTGEKDKDNQPIIKEEFDTVDLKSFNSNDIMYVMINAIKELKAEIDILKGAK